jgi:hypothetical protein
VHSALKRAVRTMCGDGIGRHLHVSPQPLQDAHRDQDLDCFCGFLESGVALRRLRACDSHSFVQRPAGAQQLCRRNASIGAAGARSLARTRSFPTTLRWFCARCDKDVRNSMPCHHAGYDRRPIHYAQQTSC